MRVAMALFSWLMVGVFVAFAGAILLLGLFSPRSGADVLDWRPARPGDGAGDDLDELLAAPNALRRRRGVPERTADDVAASVEADRRELERRARTAADRPAADR
jgi:hypothetical protein